MPISAGYVARETVTNLWRNRMMAIAAVLTVAVSLSLVGHGPAAAPGREQRARPVEPERGSAGLRSAEGVAGRDRHPPLDDHPDAPDPHGELSRPRGVLSAGVQARRPARLLGADPADHPAGVPVHLDQPGRRGNGGERLPASAGCLQGDLSLPGGSHSDLGEQRLADRAARHRARAARSRRWC